MEALRGIRGEGSKLLQLARSVPGVLCTLIGQKRPENVAANRQLNVIDPLPADRFAKAFAQVQALKRKFH